MLTPEVFSEISLFMSSEYAYCDEDDNWHLKPGAPPEVAKSFEKLKEIEKEEEKTGVHII